MTRRLTQVNRGTILLVEDDVDAREALSFALEERGFRVRAADSAERALELLEEDLDVVLTDVRMGEMDGIELCRQVDDVDDELPVIVMTAFRETDAAIAAIRARAEDFICKPMNLDALVTTLDRSIQDRQLHRKVKALSALVRESTTEKSSLIGTSAAIQQLDSVIHQVVKSSATVLIIGETGTGKELVARAIHDQSGRKGSFVAVNCAAIPATLLESELFGHVAGAFTDAGSSRRGVFSQADEGTLFLDEIGEMSPETQVKLLRVLQERKIRPVGSNEEIDIDTRIIGATNRDLSAAVASGEFREDLFYRINIVPITLPPLRARGDDVLLLAQFFVERSAKRLGKKVTGISAPVAARLRAYTWPGNVRELENTIERAVAFAAFEVIGIGDLPERILTNDKATWALPWSADTQDLPTLGEVEALHVRRVLAAVNNNKTRAAQLLGIDRRTLYRHLRHMPSSARREQTGEAGQGQK